jgi:hypothetical protein
MGADPPHVRAVVAVIMNMDRQARRIAALWVQVVELQKEVRVLRERLNQHPQDSSKPPSSDGRYNRTHKTAFAIRHCKYLNNIVEQDHRAVKRIVHPMLGFRSFWAARCTIAGIEVMHAIRKGQLQPTGTVPTLPQSSSTRWLHR